jgi:hypothetical protein
MKCLYKLGFNKLIFNNKCILKAVPTDTSLPDLTPHYREQDRYYIGIHFKEVFRGFDVHRMR